MPRLIDASVLEAWLREDAEEHYFEIGPYEFIHEYLDYMPTYSPWVRCSRETLPKESMHVLITVRVFGKLACRKAVWLEDEDCFLETEYCSWQVESVIAWMPYPKPYGEENAL